MNVTIIGTGYVGLTTGVALTHLGYSVTCVDKNQNIVNSLRADQATIHDIHEPGREELLLDARKLLNQNEVREHGFVCVGIGH